MSVYHPISDTDMYECDECKSLVWFDSLEGHTAWHRDLKRTATLANSLRPLA